MTQAPDYRGQLAADRADTLDRLAGLRRELADIVESARGSNTDDEHDPEGATIAFEREHAAALVGRGDRHLAEIDAALRRLNDGSYETCLRCGGNIAADRLAARPTAETCIDCAGRPR